jgi:integrase
VDALERAELRRAVDAATRERLRHEEAEALAALKALCADDPSPRPRSRCPRCHGPVDEQTPGCRACIGRAHARRRRARESRAELAELLAFLEGRRNGFSTNGDADRPARTAISTPGLFPGFRGANLRTAITRACKATGAPHFSPHGPRKRRGSLLSKQGYSLAEISERLGDTKVVTAEHYLYALGDYAEVDYCEALAQRA